MNISDALAYLQHVSARIRITSRNASVLIRRKWSVRVRAKGCESIEAMIIRLALKAKMQEEFTLPPASKPTPSRTAKLALKRARVEQRTVN